MNKTLWDKLPTIELADGKARQLYFSTGRSRALAKALGYNSTAELLAGLGKPQDGVRQVDVIEFLPHALHVGLVYPDGETPLTFDQIDDLVPIGQIDKLAIEVFAAFQGFSREGAAKFMTLVDMSKLSPESPKESNATPPNGPSPESISDSVPTSTGI